VATYVSVSVDQRLADVDGPMLERQTLLMARSKLIADMIEKAAKATPKSPINNAHEAGADTSPPVGSCCFFGRSRVCCY